MVDPDPVLEARHLRKVYPAVRGGNERTAVADSSFALQRGESLGIVGESGSGKTTLARILVGLEPPTAGEVLLEGTPAPAAPNAEQRSRRARQIQLVFQDPYTSLDPRQTVAAALDEVLRLHFHDRRDARVGRIRELLESVGLDERIGRLRPRQLSGGQRQRVALARALASEPSVIVLDEAVAALDVSVQAQVLNLLADLRAETRTAFVFISHDLAVVGRVTDRVQVMRHGVVVEEGLTASVLAEPAHPYTRTLLDSIPRQGWRPRVTAYSEEAA